MPLPPIICPACGSDRVQTLIGLSRLCENCGHWFRVVNGQTQPEEEDDDDGEG